MRGVPHVSPRLRDVGRRDAGRKTGDTQNVPRIFRPIELVKRPVRPQVSVIAAERNEMQAVLVLVADRFHVHSPRL